MAPLIPIYAYTMSVNNLPGMCLNAQLPAITPIASPINPYRYVVPTNGVL